MSALDLTLFDEWDRKEARELARVYNQKVLDALLQPTNTQEVVEEILKNGNEEAAGSAAQSFILDIKNTIEHPEMLEYLEWLADWSYQFSPTFSEKDYNDLFHNFVKYLDPDIYNCSEIVERLDRVYSHILNDLLMNSKNINNIMPFCFHMSKITHRSRKEWMWKYYTKWKTYGSITRDLVSTMDDIEKSGRINNLLKYNSEEIGNVIKLLKQDKLNNSIEELKKSFWKIPEVMDRHYIINIDYTTGKITKWTYFDRFDELTNNICWD